MWLIAEPLIAIVVAAGGVLLITRRNGQKWRLWTGIGLLALFLISLPITIPFALLGFLLVTGGSFS